MLFNIFKKKKKKIYMVFKKDNVQFNICYINKECLAGDPRLNNKVLTFNSIVEATRYLDRFKGERNFQIIFKEI